MFEFILGVVVGVMLMWFYADFKEDISWWRDHERRRKVGA